MIGPVHGTGCTTVVAASVPGPRVVRSQPTCTCLLTCTLVVLGRYDTIEDVCLLPVGAHTTRISTAAVPRPPCCCCLRLLLLPLLLCVSHYPACPDKCIVAFLKFFPLVRYYYCSVLRCTHVECRIHTSICMPTFLPHPRALCVIQLLLADATAAAAAAVRTAPCRLNQSHGTAKRRHSTQESPGRICC